MANCYVKIAFSAMSQLYRLEGPASVAEKVEGAAPQPECCAFSDLADTIVLHCFLSCRIAVITHKETG